MTRPKTESRSHARELRRAGLTYDQITAALGVAKSSVSLWVRDLPKPPTPPDRLHRMREARWGPHREEQARLRARTAEAARAEIGPLTDRELFLVGVGLYWAEGAKRKAHRPSDRVCFVNSDPDMVRLFLGWLRLVGVEAERHRYTLMIHESADVERAERFWRGVTGAGPDRFTKTVLKRHNPKTVRANVGEGYHGCLAVRALQGADLYRRIEGWWCGIVEAADRGD